MDNTLPYKNLFKIFSNTAWLLGGQVFVRLIKFGVVLIAARTLGLESYGIFAHDLAFVALFFILASLFHTLSPVQRDVAAQEDKAVSIFGKHVPWRLGVGVITLAVVMISWAFVHTGPVWIVIILAVSLCLDFIRDIIGILFLARQQMKDESLSLILQTVAVLVATLIFLLSHLTPITLAIAYLCGSLTGIITSLILARKHISLTRVYRMFAIPTKDFFLECLSYGFGFGLAWILAISFMFQLSIFIVGFFVSPQIAGGFSLVMQITQVLVVPYMVFGSTHLSFLSVQKTPQEFSRIVGGMIGLYFASIIPYFVLTRTIIFFGLPFVLKAQTLQVINPYFVESIVIVFLVGALANMFYIFLSRRHFSKILPFLIGGFVIGVFIIYMGAYWYGAHGLALALIGTYTILVSSLAILLYFDLEIKEVVRSFVSGIVILIASLLPLLILHFYGVSNIFLYDGVVLVVYLLFWSRLKHIAQAYSITS